MSYGHEYQCNYPGSPCNCKMSGPKEFWVDPNPHSGPRLEYTTCRHTAWSRLHIDCINVIEKSHHTDMMKKHININHALVEENKKLKSAADKLVEVSKAILLHCLHPIIDENWCYYMETELRPKLEQALTKYKEEMENGRTFTESKENEEKIK